MEKYKKYEIEIPLDFESDGCTFAPDGSWGSCCVLHDHAKKNRKVTAEEADTMLLACMKDRASPLLAYIYFFAVRFRSITKISPLGIIFLVGFLSVVGLLIKYG